MNEAPPAGRIDNVAGDRNLVCYCPLMEAYAEAADAKSSRVRFAPESRHLSGLTMMSANDPKRTLQVEPHYPMGSLTVTAQHKVNLQAMQHVSLWQSEQ